MHKDHELAKQERKNWIQRTERFMVGDSGKREAPSDEQEPAEQSAKRQKTWWKPKPNQDFITGYIARWLIRDGLPHHMVTTPAFRAMVAALTGDSDVTVLSAQTYNDIVDTHYAKFQESTADLIVKEHKELHETPFMNLMHDLWTNSAKNCIVGASVSYIDRSWRFVQLALLALTKNDGHDSEEVVKLLNVELKRLFGVDIEAMVRFSISDTALAARKISKQFDTTLQTDCAMHTLNLCLRDGIGLKENVRSQYSIDPTTNLAIKKKVVVTAGRTFPEGTAVIRKLRALNNYFASSKSPQRIARLTEVQLFHQLPQLAAIIDVDVRVASAIKLFQRSIINYTAFRAYFQNANLAAHEKEVFNSISAADWELVIEMEAIMERVAVLALIESQSANMISSTMYVLLRVTSARMNTYKFFQYQLDGNREEDTNEKSFPRVTVKFDDISALGHRCIKRTLHQIAARLPNPSVQMGMTILLDSRTKKAAKNYLWIPDTAESVANNILEETRELLFKEHRVFFRAKFARCTHDDALEVYTSSSPDQESLSASDSELELLCGEAVSQQPDRNPVEDAVDVAADELVEKWLNHCVDWADVARQQYANDEERDAVLEKLSMRTMQGTNVWNVEQLCQHIDVCRWFREYGENEYPTIAKLARVWLGRSSSTAFQERVFSTGSFVMSPLRTRTDNERALRQLVLHHNRAEIQRMEE